MKRTSIYAAIATAALLAAPAVAQETGTQQQTGAQPQAGAQQTGVTQGQMTDQELRDAETAAERMITTIYIREPVTHWMPRDVVARLQELGYTNIHDFDVEARHYEVEATAPTGEEVEIEVDPISGAILDIEENWF